MVESNYMPLDGANAVSQAMRQINPDVLAAYPITPQTAVVQHFSQYVADGIVDTEFVPVESEHAAMSACVGAAAAGAHGNVCPEERQQPPGEGGGGSQLVGFIMSERPPRKEEDSSGKGNRGQCLPAFYEGDRQEAGVDHQQV